MENETALTENERNIMYITCFGHFLCHFNMLTFPAVVLPLAALLKLPLADVLGISYWMYLLFGISALPWGIIADRFGAKLLMGLYYGGAGLCGMAVAVTINFPGTMEIALAGIGFFSGIYHPVALGLISKQVSRISYCMGINGMFGNLGLAMAPLVTGGVTWLWGPISAYVVLGGLNLLGLVILLGLPFKNSESSSPQYKTNSTGKGFFILLLAMMLGGIVYRGATVILPAYLELRNKVMFNWLSELLSVELSTNIVATTITSFIFIAGMIGQYLGGKTAEHFSLQYSYLVFHLITIPTAFAMANAVGIPLIFAALVYFFFLLGMQPIENTLVSRLTPAKWHHSAFGMKFVLAFGVGALAVKGVEAIEKNIGLKWVYPCMGSVSVALVLTIIILIFRIGRANQP
jgi:MFS family permease